MARLPLQLKLIHVMPHGQVGCEASLPVASWLHGKEEMDFKLAAEHVARLRKLRQGYRKAVDRFTETRDLREMRSAAIEMKALASEVDALLKELKHLEKGK